jgi:hypothetical protein
LDGTTFACSSANMEREADLCAARARGVESPPPEDFFAVATEEEEDWDAPMLLLLLRVIALVVEACCGGPKESDFPILAAI